MLHAFSRTPIKVVVWIAAAMIVTVTLRIGGTFALRVGQFSPLTGALIGSGLALISTCFPRRRDERTEPWTGFEQLSWMLIGLGMLLWAVGESFWRYFVALGMTPFPSVADVGYSLFPLLAFVGLLLQPAPNTGSRRVVLIMDSLISMMSLFAMAWYLLLGNLAQAPGEASLAKFLGLYYPVADMALLSCIVFLLLRGQQGRVYQTTASRVSLLVVGLGVCFFVGSDFVFNIRQNAGTYVEATWIDLGWPLGMMTMGVAAYLRRFLPVTPPVVIEQPIEQRFEHTAANPFQFVPYGLLGLLLLALALDGLASDAGQQAIRPVLLLATVGVVVLVVARQILTLRDNMHLTQRQAEALERLEQANQRVEEQARQMAEYTTELERGIEHLRNVHASLANGNLRARAALTGGVLLPLAGSLNLMAERLMRLGQANQHAQRVLTALGDLSVAFECHGTGAPFAIPPSCHEHVEIHRLLTAMRMKGGATAVPPVAKQPSASSSLRTTFPLRSSAPPNSPLSPLHTPPPVTEPLPPRRTTSLFPSTESSLPPELPPRGLGVRRPPNSEGFGPRNVQGKN